MEESYHKKRNGENHPYPSFRATTLERSFHAMPRFQARSRIRLTRDAFGRVFRAQTMRSGSLRSEPGWFSFDLLHTSFTRAPTFSSAVILWECKLQGGHRRSVLFYRRLPSFSGISSINLVTWETRMAHFASTFWLLFTPMLTLHAGEVIAYRRVTAETLIMVLVEEKTPAMVNKLVSSVRLQDVP